MSASSSQPPESWISAFCSLVGHEYFAEVSEDFIEDDFNLTGLQSQVPMYKEALEMILDVEPEDASEEDEDDDDEDDEDDDDMQDGGDGGPRPGGYRRAQDAAAAAAERRHLRMASDLSMIESSAEMLYGLIHQRFITSRPGIQQMAEKYELGHFGHCPRVFCHGAKVLPVGCSDIPGQETVKLFCPSCLDVYSPPNSRFQTVDGAFFGTTFGCLFFMTFPELEVGGQKPPLPSEPSGSASSPLSHNAAHPATTQTSLNKDSRNSLSSSLASQQAIPPPPPLPTSTISPSSTTSAAPASSAQQPQSQPQSIQPESINGVAPKNLAPGLGPSNIYEPRIYGFRVAEIAKTGPRMKWLRSRPVDVAQLDECRVWALANTNNSTQTAAVPAAASHVGVALQPTVFSPSSAAGAGAAATIVVMEEDDDDVGGGELADSEMPDGEQIVEAEDQVVGRHDDDDDDEAMGDVEPEEDEEGGWNGDATSHRHGGRGVEGGSPAATAAARVKEAAQRSKTGRRRRTEGLLNGDGGGVTAVRVGDGG